MKILPGLPLSRVLSVPSSGRKACVTTSGATRLTSSCLRSSAGASSATGSDPTWIPALLTSPASTLRGPRIAATLTAAAATASASQTSSTSGVKSEPASPRPLRPPTLSSSCSASAALRTVPKTW